MDYKGIIIEESLTNRDIIEKLEIVSQETEEVTKEHNTPWLTKWTLDTVVIKQNEIDKITQSLSELIDSNHCDDWYCDFRNDEYHYIVFKNKVFKINRQDKKGYIAMQAYAESLGLPKWQMPSYLGLDEALLKKFLLKAKKMTYASSDAPKVSSSRIESVDYEFKESVEGEEMIYHDTFFGGTKFIGEEVIYRGGKVKWAMNYYGVTLDDNLSEEVMDNALRPALMQVGKDESVLPVRGPSHFVNNGYTYTFSSEGDLFNFTGTEEIYYKDNLIFTLKCHGGIIE